jgi:hypothetical protein
MTLAGEYLLGLLRVENAVPYHRFYDGTDNPGRPGNYHLTFSRSERNQGACRHVLAADHNVAVVFRRVPFPATFWGYPVIDGDAHDLRFLDQSPCVVGLRARGKGARTDRTGFVVDADLPLRGRLELTTVPPDVPHPVT